MDTNFRLKSSFHRSPLSRKRARERERGSIIARNFYRKRLDYASVANTKKVGTWNLGSKDSNRIFNFRTRKRFDGTRFDFVENENGRERKETIANHGKSPPRYRVTIILMPDSVTPSSHPPTKITQWHASTTLNCSIRSFTYNLPQRLLRFHLVASIKISIVRLHFFTRITILADE